jgi:hypothetical protein
VIGVWNSGDQKKGWWLRGLKTRNFFIIIILPFWAFAWILQLRHWRRRFRALAHFFFIAFLSSFPLLHFNHRLGPSSYASSQNCIVGRMTTMQCWLE